MSENFEESPVSDGKMDISEATSSQESACISPIAENFSSAVKLSSIITPTSSFSVTETSDSQNKLTEIDNCDDGGRCDGNRTEEDNNKVLQQQQQKQTMKLDNLRLDNDPSNRVLRLGHQGTIAITQKQQQLHHHHNQNPTNSMLRSELTVANSHPLMSPSGTDTDSENGHRRVFSFPDVVPESEPLRLGNPNRLNKKNNCTSSSTTADYTTTTTTTITTKGSSTTQKRKISVKRAPSPDLLSSESEQDLSQYQANVEPNYQSVALISNNLNRNIKMPSPKPLTRRKIPVSTDLLSDDMSSLDSISNHSFDDDDMEHNLASLSPSSSILDGINDRENDFADLDTPTNLPPEPIPTYTAEDERRDSRNWQKITLPDGKTREIDMKVIEPYKRVLSHGGYLKAGGHNAIVMFCACHLPDKSRADYHYVMDNLFLYVVKTLEQLVTDDYVLVYLHGGCSRRNVPPFPWLKKCYQLLDRRLRKSLKNLYLVHPTFWLKSVVWMSRPFVSSKFWRKLVYVRSLEELHTLVSVEKASIPDKVKNFDAKYT